MKNGGKRKGAGNKAGSIRPNFNAYWSLKDVEEYMQHLKETYKTSPELTKYVGDHLFGKAPQPLTGADGEKLFPEPILAGKTNVHSNKRNNKAPEFKEKD